MNGSFAAWLSSWSRHTPRKSRYISSTTGRMPAIAAPTPRPTIALSEIGVSRTRSPNAVVQPARQAEHVAAGARRRCRRRTRARRRRARPRARRGSRPWCGTPARRRPGAGGSARVGSGADDEVGQRRGRRGREPRAPRRRRRRARRATDDSQRLERVVGRRPADRSRRACTSSGSRASHSCDLVGRPVALRVAFVVTVPAVGRRPRRRRDRARRATASTTVAHRGRGRDDVVAVDRDVVDAVAGGALLERRRVLGRRGRELGVAVVLAEEDHRQLPHRGEVDRFVERAVRDRAVAEERDRDAAVVRAAAPRSRRRPRSAGPAPTIPLAPKMPSVGIGDVHRAAAAAVRALRPWPSARRTSRAGRGPSRGSGRGRDGST